MAEILAYAADQPLPADPDQAAWRWRKGFVVALHEDGQPWGSREGLPAFVRILLPGVPTSDLAGTTDVWETMFDFEVVGSDPSIDGYRIAVVASHGRASDLKGAVTRTRVEAYLNSWNAVVVSTSFNRVVFDVRIFDAATSNAFWERAVGSILFTERAYDQASGTHDVRADYSATGLPSAGVEAFVASKAQILAHNTSTRRLDYRVSRTSVREEFRGQVQQIFSGVVQQRRWYVDPLVVDAAIAAGGEIVGLPLDVRDALAD